MSGPQWSANCGECPPGYLVVSGQFYIVHIPNMYLYTRTWSSRHWRTSQPSGEEGIPPIQIKYFQ